MRVKGGGQMSRRHEIRSDQARMGSEPQKPVELPRIQPTRPIRIVFWVLRLYIAAMVALVIIGFARGLH